MKPLLRFRRALGRLFLLCLLLPSLARAGLVVTGADTGAPSHVKVFFMPSTTPTKSFFAYGQGFTGGVRVALGDVNGDGTADIITGAGPGAGPHVKVFDGSNGAEIRSFFPYDPGFGGGVFVGAGDVNGDGFADIVTGSGAGGAAHVKVFNGSSNAEMASFLPFGGAFQGGVRVAVGDVNGDGIPDVITGAATSSSHVKAFHGRTQSELMSFFAYTPTFAGGVYVAAGDVNGDGRADVITGAGPGAGPHVKVFSGADGALLRSFFAYEGGFTGGVRVGAGDVDGDGRADVHVSPGSGRAAQIKVFDGRRGSLKHSFFPFEPSFTGGVFVGGNAVPPVVVTTSAATEVTVSSATLNGTVDPNGRTVSVKFQYGLTTSYGSTAPADPAQVSGSTPSTVSAEIAGLQPGKLYHFRVVANDGIGGTVAGLDRTFLTTLNKAPSGGSLVLTPASPVGAGTVLTATFDGWTDEEGNLPLKYEVLEGATVIVPRTETSAPQFILPVGTHVLRGRIYDSLGVHTETVPVEIEVEGAADSEVRAVSGEPVTGAGSSGIPEDAIWTGFGVPAMADDSVKFIGNHTSPSGRGSGIFSNWTPIALSGGPVPGSGAGGDFEIPTDAVFKKFKDPVTDAEGHVAFVATMQGPGVTPRNDTLLLSDAQNRTPEILAREGSAAPGMAGAKFADFQGISVAGTGQGGTIFTARLAGAKPGQNRGVWWRPTGFSATGLLLHTGMPGLSAEDTIRSFALHTSFPGTLGHGRGQMDGQTAFFQLAFRSGQQGVFKAASPTGELLAKTGDAVGDSSVWVRMAQPSSSRDGEFLSVRGTTVPGNAPANSRPGTGVYKSVDSGKTWTALATVGGLAAGTDAVWIDLGYPVSSLSGDAIAFLGKVRGGTVKGSMDTGVWWQPEGEPLGLLAQEGTQAVGCAIGENFLQFKSLAHTSGDSGPIFVAKLGGRGVNAGNDMGVWAVDSSGSLRLLFREGQKIGTKTLLNFSVLEAVSGSPGVTRAFNSQGEVAWRATFTDRSTGIVVTQIH